MKKSEIVDAVIIGGGPAGISASIQLKRLGLHPLLIEKEKIGGSLLNASLVENYLGFPKGIRGCDLVKLIREHFKQNEVKTLFSEVTAIAKKANYFEIFTETHKIYAKTVVVATGSIPKKIGLPIEKELCTAKKLFYEIKEVPSNIHNRIFTVIGSGDAAFDYALNLSEKNNNVNIVCRGTPKCLGILLKRAKQDTNIKLYTNTKVVAIQNTEDSITLVCEEGKKFISDYVLVAIGKIPNIEILDIAIRSNLSTKPSGLSIVGDAKRDSFRQVGIAVGDGLLAAMQIKKYLDEKHGDSR